jgi:hypothetical protein
MAEVINLDEHRSTPGTAWWSGTLKCVFCCHEQNTVCPIPEWAATPMTSECGGCGRMGAIEMHTPPEALNATATETPWLEPSAEGHTATATVVKDET